MISNKIILFARSKEEKNQTGRYAAMPRSLLMTTSNGGRERVFCFLFFMYLGRRHAHAQTVPVHNGHVLGSASARRRYPCSFHPTIASIIGVILRRLHDPECNVASLHAACIVESWSDARSVYVVAFELVCTVYS